MNPCRTASIPYWKAKSITIPESMKNLHQDDYIETEYRQYIDEPYFRLIYDLRGLYAPVLPRGYSFCTASVRDFAEHINGCYDGIGITEAELRGYTERSVYNADFWLAVKDDRTGKIIATAIGELDTEIG